MRRIFISLTLLLLGVSLAAAQEGYVDVIPVIPGSADAEDPAGIVANFYTFALMIGGVLAFGAIVWGGLKYITAGGNSHSQGEGKEWIKSALWGLLLLVGASIILNTINPRITSLSLPNVERPSNYGTGGGGLVDGIARGTLSEAGVGIKQGVSLAGTRAETVQEIVKIKNECGCDIFVTSGTEGSHAEGTYSHYNGYKVDLRPNQALDDYIRGNYQDIGLRRDGARQYRSPSGAVYAREGDHWDVLVRP
jgi:hypothetical protein